ncbi:uncharacterized protein DC041_0010753 [Schistosoma bovis]|uniref:SCP domain-containing protein n=1 Tax=Schistosoma bovis TaxID=6184 RepID=A0A430Q3K1_SCHBO|nr:uncharacterized protein DC041_0010753 [Schistosoma bovis]
MYSGCVKEIGRDHTKFTYEDNIQMIKKCIYMTASLTRTRYQRMVPTLLLAICSMEAVFGLNAVEEQLMLKVHNEHRRYRSKYNKTDIVPAEAILQPLWDDELEAAAQRWSQKCDAYDEEPIGSVGKFDSVGRNTAVISELAEAVTYWMEESDHYDHNSDQCEPPHQCDSYKQNVCAYERRLATTFLSFYCFYFRVIKRQPYTDEKNCGCKNVTEGQNKINEKKKKVEQKTEHVKWKMEKKEEKKAEEKEKKKTEKKRKLEEK